MNDERKRIDSEHKNGPSSQREGPDFDSFNELWEDNPTFWRSVIHGVLANNGLYIVPIAGIVALAWIGVKLATTDARLSGYAFAGVATIGTLICIVVFPVVQRIRNSNATVEKNAGNVTAKSRNERSRKREARKPARPNAS